MSFIYHRHGKGPFHYSAEIENNLIFEIYPLLSRQNQVNTSLRLGFKVENLDELIEKLASENVVIERKPQQSKWGYYAVIRDLDGRKIELKEIELK